MKQTSEFGLRGNKLQKARARFKNGTGGKPKNILHDVRKIMNTPGIQYRLNSQDVTEIKTLLRRITDGHDVGLKTGEHGLVIGTCHDMLRKWGRKNPSMAVGKSGKSGGTKADTFSRGGQQKPEVKKQIELGQKPPEEGGAIRELDRDTIRRWLGKTENMGDVRNAINKLGTNQVEAFRKYLKEHPEYPDQFWTPSFCETALITRKFGGDFLGGASRIIARNGNFGELNKFIDGFWDRMVGQGYEARGIYEAIHQLTRNPDNWQGQNAVKYRQYLDNAWRRLYKRR